MQLPEPVLRSSWGERATAAAAAVRGAAAALLELRGTVTGVEAAGGQLKTSTDFAAEGWILGFLRGRYPDDRFLAEELFEQLGTSWPGALDYWTVDALDGTRSYVEGYAGFCVQVAFIAGGTPCLGAIMEPMAGTLYIAAAGAGAWRVTSASCEQLPMLVRRPRTHARFVDSTRPEGPAGKMFESVGGRFVECGSVGLKICRVVEDRADIYAKRFRYKTWDVAPGEVLLREVGGKLGSWDGEVIDYSSSHTHYETVLATERALYDELVASCAFSE